MPRIMPIRPANIGLANRPGECWKTPGSGSPRSSTPTWPLPAATGSIFTSGGTEANNLAILGMARPAATPEPAAEAEEGQGTKAGQPGQIIISAGEHQSVIEPAEHLLERAGGWTPWG